MSRPSPPRLPRPPLPGRADRQPDAAAAPEPDPRWSGDLTPLPPPLPHHVADPTRTSQPRLVDDADATEEDLSLALETRRMPRITDRDLEKLSGLSHGELPEPVEVGPCGFDDDVTEPGEPPRRGRSSSLSPDEVTGLVDSPLFAPVPARDRLGVLRRFQRRTAAIGTTVIRRGEAGHGLVLVVRGRLDQHTERADGARVSLREVVPGDFVGEVSLLARAPASAYVVAAADCELLVLGASDFHALIAAFPALGAELAQIAERRVRDDTRVLTGG